MTPEERGQALNEAVNEQATELSKHARQMYIGGVPIDKIEETFDLMGEAMAMACKKVVTDLKGSVETNK